MTHKHAQSHFWAVWIGIFLLQILLLVNCGSEDSTESAETSASMSIEETNSQNARDADNSNNRGNPTHQEGNISGHDDRNLCPGCMRATPPIRRPIPIVNPIPVIK